MVFRSQEDSFVFHNLVKFLLVGLIVVTALSLSATHNTAAVLAQEKPTIQVRVLENGSGWRTLTGFDDVFTLNPAPTGGFWSTDGSIRNLGNEPLTITNVTLAPLSPAGHNAIRVSVLGSLPVSLLKNQSLRFTMFLEANSPGTYSSRLAISHNAANAPIPFQSRPTGLVYNQAQVRVEQAWNGVQVPNGGSFRYPDTPVGNLPISRLFNICNDGTGNMQITNPSALVSGIGYSQIGASPAAMVSPGTCTNFRVRFHTNNTGAHYGRVNINYNDPQRSSNYSFNLLGVATAN